MTNISTISKGSKLAWENDKQIEDSFSNNNPGAPDDAWLVPLQPDESDPEPTHAQQHATTCGNPWVFALIITNVMTAFVVGGLTVIATYITLKHGHISGIISTR